MTKKFTFNIPNTLSVIRIVLIPIVVVFAAKGQMIGGIIVYIAACATDVLDGLIARKLNQITDVGKLLDPLADKLMIIAMVTTFTILGLYPLFVLLIIGIKELLMIIGGAFLLKKDIVVFSNVYGKVAAFANHLSIGFAFLSEYYGKTFLYFMYLTIVMTVVSMIQYFYINLYQKYLKEKRVKRQ